MKYVITSITKQKNLVHYFDPMVDIEIYDSYFKALRSLVSTLHSMMSCGYYATRFQPTERSEFGRVVMYQLNFRKDNFTYEHKIVRLPENGLH